MALIRYNPLNDFVPGTFGDLIESVLKDSRQKEGTFNPAVDILKNEKEIQLLFFVPGMSKSDFDVDLRDNNLLSVSGERKLDKDIKDNYKQIESQFGKFSKSFKLSDTIDKEGIKADYKEGVLQITLPLVEKKDIKTTITIK